MRVLYVEPFDSGSHASFTRVLTGSVRADWTVLRLPGRHWKWRMRGSAAHFATTHAEVLAQPFDVVFASAYLPLAELRGLAPALARTPAVLYFHENQLAFPWRAEPAERDLHYGFTQIVAALAATRCVFNSDYNRDTFLELGEAALRRMPDANLPGWRQKIRERSSVLGVPLELEDEPPPLVRVDDDTRARGPTILWNHRWEHDKNPEGFFAALTRLADEGLPFRVAVCGKRFRLAPKVFATAREALGPRVVHWGELDGRSRYLELLGQADIALSTANHEFFGVAMLEAAHRGAFVLAPRRLAYPEHFPAEHLYADDDDLVAALTRLVRRYLDGETLRADRRPLTRPYLAKALAPRFEALLESLC